MIIVISPHFDDAAFSLAATLKLFTPVQKVIVTIREDVLLQPVSESVYE